MAKLLHKQPQKVTGRHAYFAELMRTRAFTRQNRTRVGKDTVSEKVVLGKHGQYWSRMSSEKKKVYDTQAFSMIQKRTAEIATQWAEHDFAAQKLASDISSKQSGSMGSERLQRCKLTPEDVEQLQSRVNAPRKKSQTLESCGLHAVSPDKVAESKYRELEAASTLFVESSVSLSRTGRLLAKMRDVLSDAVIVVRSSGKTRYYRYVCASLHLRGELVVMPLETADLPASQMTVQEFLEGAKNPPMQLWTYESGLFDRALRAEDLALHDLGVIQRTVFKALGYIAFVPQFQTLHPFLLRKELTTEKKYGLLLGSHCIDGSWDLSIPFVHLLSSETGATDVKQEPSKRQKTSEHASSSSSALPASFVEFMNRKDFTPTISVGAVPATATPELEEEGDDEIDEDGDDIEVSALFHELEQRRQDIEYSAEDQIQEHFRVSVIGGAWSMARSSRHIYGFRADLQRASPIHEFCERFGLHLSASFSEEKYGHRGGEILRKLWMHRLSFLSGHWTSTGSEGFQTATLPAYEVPVAYRDEARNMTGQSAKRRDEIIDMLPAAKPIRVKAYTSSPTPQTKQNKQ
eukprot:6491909-Amphidinium_carterae.3